jgi:hypothetical protein
MKTLFSLFAVALLVLAVGCSTVDSRISKLQALFDAWPAEVQQKIRAGRVDLGFTPEQVRVALGEPAKKYNRTTAQGKSEVWSYADRSFGVSLGVGVGSARGAGLYGGGVAYEPASYGADDESGRIIFEDGRVTSVEKREK